MIKLLKYDWKRNANTLVAAAVILIAAQTLLLVSAYRNNWGPEGAYVAAVAVYAFASLLTFIMVCQTYNANIRAYSRRLLPLPPLYGVVSPVLLFLGCQLVLALTLAAVDWAISLVFDTGGLLLTLIPVDISPAGYVNITAGALYMGIGLCIVVFFCITAAATVAGRWGTWFGLAVFAVLLTIKSWADSKLFPYSWGGNSAHFGITVTAGEPSGLSVSVTGLRMVEWLSVLYEIAFLGLLLYGIHYMLTRRIKL